MSNIFRITFRNYDLNSSGKQRLENILKGLYWKNGEEPSDWKLFDGDFIVSEEPSRGGDCASFSSKDEKWSDWAFEYIRHGKLNADIKDVEILLTHDNAIYTQDKDKRRNIEPIQAHMIGNYYSFYN